MKAMAAAVLLLAHPVATLAATQAGGGGAAAAAARADRMLEQGRYRDAREAFVWVGQYAGGSATLKARALFGQALVTQQASALDSSIGSLDAVLAGYLEARKLDSTRLYGAASNNAGLLLRSQGRHREALPYFLQAASAADPYRPYYYLNAGRELERLGRPDSAAAAYRMALKADKGYAEARRALLTLYVARGDSDSLLALARRWEGDPVSTSAFNDAVLTLLSNSSAELSAERVEALLIALCDNWAAVRLSPAHFETAYRERLAPIGRARAELAPAIAAVLDAYRVRGATELYEEPAGTTWWRRWQGDRGPRKTWSRLLRSIGDRYDQADNAAVAASFYEAAVGYPANDFAAPWLDLDALLPLGAIYVSRAQASGENARAVERLNHLTDQLFMGKGRAYGAGDLRRIRSFHMTLGHIYAEQKRWGDMGDVRSAVFQLERMRMVTQIMRQDGDTTAIDPPALLEELATAYAGTGRSHDARTVSEAAAAGYDRLGRPADAARVKQWSGRLPP
jgi:tetratricopeptide (TPR) repeat protein